MPRVVANKAVNAIIALQRTLGTAAVGAAGGAYLGARDDKDGVSGWRGAAIGGLAGGALGGAYAGVRHANDAGLFDSIGGFLKARPAFAANTRRMAMGAGAGAVLGGAYGGARTEDPLTPLGGIVGGAALGAGLAGAYGAARFATGTSKINSGTAPFDIRW